MPATIEAAQATDAYRRRLMLVRDAAANAVAAGLVAVNLDLAPGALARSLGDWHDSSVEVIEGSRMRAADASRGYLTAYLSAVGLTAPIVDDPPAVDVAIELVAARKALLFMLGRGDGRVAAQRYGRYVAERQARTLIGEAARHVLAAGIEQSPEISGWRRVTATATCQRCATLARHFYTYRATFDGHLSCRCTAEPVVRNMPELVVRAPAAVVAA